MIIGELNCDLMVNLMVPDDDFMKFMGNGECNGEFNGDYGEFCGESNGDLMVNCDYW